MRNRKEATAAAVLPADGSLPVQAQPAGRKRRRFWIFILTLFVVAGTVIILYLMSILLPSMYRQQAARMIVPTMHAAKVHDVVYFGSYEQDNDKSNGSEPIEWIVMEKQADRCLLMSRYGLDCVRFNTVEAFVTWDKSSILTWLNNTFYYDAFNSTERTLILATEQSTDINPYFDTNPGSVTKEKVYLPNIAEVALYMPTEEERQCIATPYATDKGAITGEETGCCLWWLRSPGFDTSTATRVLMDGRINYCGYRVHSNRQAVRPFIWVSFDPYTANKGT